MSTPRGEMLAKARKGGDVMRERYAGTDYWRQVGAKGGRAGRGVKKPRKPRVVGGEAVFAPSTASRIDEILADLERA